MDLTPEQEEIGRRNFLKALAGTPALAALAGATALHGPKRGGPVKAAVIGAGGQAKTLMGQFQKEWIDFRAICEINPSRSRQAAEGMEKNGWPRPRAYQDLKEMLEKEDLEAVIVSTPLWTHADLTVTALEAGKHVFCEKMMAYDEEGCRRMIEAAQRNRRVLEIGYQRFYNPIYQAAYEGIVRKGTLGDVYFIRTAWHRDGTWRMEEPPPSPDYDPGRWGYPSWEHLLNWRLYRRYSGGLIAELGSHQIAVANWFFDAMPEAVYSSGGTHRYKDGREVFDHVFATFDYPGGRNVTFSSIQSNAHGEYYEEILGTKGTLILKAGTEAFLFQNEEAKATGVSASPRDGNAIVDASESRAADAAGRRVPSAATDAAKSQRLIPYRNEIAEFCAAIRTGSPVRCGPERAARSARACIKAIASGYEKTRMTLA